MFFLESDALTSYIGRIACVWGELAYLGWITISRACGGELAQKRRGLSTYPWKDWNPDGWLQKRLPSALKHNPIRRRDQLKYINTKEGPWHPLST
jgi:hypothetical protein